MSERAIPVRHGGAQWDEKRNTSRVFPVPPGSLEAALRALQSVDPTLRRWITEGHPRLTEREHVERFGGPYKSARKRLGGAPSRT